MQLGLLVFHSTDTLRDIGPGFPDLTIVGPNGVIFAELKSDSGSRSIEQSRWFYGLIEAGATYALWKPSDLRSGTIARALEYLATRLPMAA